MLLPETLEGHMTVKTDVKKAIQQLESLCQSYEKEPYSGLANLEETVTQLSSEVQSLDLASDQVLKQDLSLLESALARLTSMLSQKQVTLAKQVQEIKIHQRALNAYAQVANNNLLSLA